MNTQTLEAPATVEEIDNAIPLAMEKLQRIFSREGDDCGKRLKPSYVTQLIYEQVRETRASQAYNGKEPAARTTDSITNYSESP